MTIKIVLLLCVSFFIASVSYAGFYEDQNDYDPSFQGEDFNKAFPQEVENHPTNSASYPRNSTHHYNNSEPYDYDLPEQIQTSEKLVLVDPNLHAWGAYSASGKLIKAGRASAGANWCSDIGRGCKTNSGTFRVYSLGSSDCVSSKYPIDEGGGAPMPYCMYFNGSQGLHGSDHVVEGNISHGCVRLRVSDAEWLRFNFVDIGTKVIVKPY